MFSESYICKTKILFFLNGDKGKQLKHCGMPPSGSHQELHTIQASQPLDLLMWPELYPMMALNQGSHNRIPQFTQSTPLSMVKTAMRCQ